jgi:hypothetical protein
MSENLQSQSTHPIGWGADRPFENRPGVPKLRLPPKLLKGAHEQIKRQPRTRKAPTKRVELKQLTPVFGTAQLPHGLSGLIRRLAYRLPEHEARHWLLLLTADRIDVLGHRLVKGGIALTAGVVFAAGGWVATRALRQALSSQRHLVSI